MYKHYTITIRYFLLMFLMLLITGVWMLLLHTPLNLESLTDYYVQKSVFGLLEVATPHLFAIGSVIFILTHFLSLKNKNTPFETKITLILFGMVLLSNLSGFFITDTISWMIWIKIISTVLFLLFSLMIMWRVFWRKY